MLPVAVAQSSSGSIAILYILIVLRVMSCFPVMDPMAVFLYCRSLAVANYDNL